MRTPDGGPLWLARAFARDGVYRLTIAFIPLVPLISRLWRLRDGERRTFHDMLARTRVFEVR